MQNAMFSGVFAALTSEHRMAVISNNLANVNTSGYKADKLAFKDTMQHFAHDFIREPLENLRSKPLFPESRLRSRVRLAIPETAWISPFPGKVFSAFRLRTAPFSPGTGASVKTPTVC